MESLSRPLHRRKLSSANGFSFSAKQHPYDDVFAQKKFGAPVFSSGAPDYSEIFGGSRGSSIPVLDLSGLDDTKISDDCRSSSSKLDYSNIFGGFCEEDIAVPYDELFSGAKRSSGKTRTASEGSDQFSPSGRHKESSCEATNQSIDGPKHFNLSYHKTGQRNRNGSNGMTQIAQLHAVPGFMYFIDESSHLPKTEAFQRAPFVKSDVQRNKSFSGEIFKEGRDKVGELHVPKIQRSDEIHRNRSFSGEIFKEGRGRMGDLHVPKAQSSDEIRRNRSFSGETGKEGHARTGDLHVPKKQSSDGHRNRRLSGEIFKEGHDKNGDLHVPKKQSSGEAHHDGSFSGELFNGGDRKENLHIPKKQSSDGVMKVISGSSWDAFHFNDKFYSAHDEFERRSSSTEGASTSSPMANDIKGQPNQSKISGPDPKYGASGSGIRPTNTSPTSSDEELDANSAAAVSAATLKKAIEKAQESIRLAKELMERKKEGVPASQKPRSKGSLKSKDNRVECNTRSNRENAMELHRKIGIGLPPFAEVCRGIPSSNGDFASFINLKEQQWVAGMVKQNTQTENAEASQGDVAGAWFPEVVSSRKENIETMVSQQVESNNHSQPSVENNRHVYKLKEMNTSNKTIELGEEPDYVKPMGEMPTLNLLGKAEAPEQFKDTSNSALMHDSEEYVNSEVINEYGFSKGNGNCSAELKKSEYMKNNLESIFHKMWSFKNLQNSQETLTEEKVGFQETENDNLHNNRETPPEDEAVKHEDLECRIVPNKLENVYEVEENKSRLRRSSNEEETEIMHKEAFLWVENDEKPQHDCGRVGIESRQEDFQRGEHAEKWSYGVHELEPSEKKTPYCHEGEESERKREGSEMEGHQKISLEPCQYEATEEIENQADKFTESKKTEASQEAEEADSRLEASDKSEDDQETSVAPGVADKQNSKSAVNEPDLNGSPRSSEIQEACEDQLENNDVEISQQAVNFEGVQGISEAIYERECEKDGVTEESSNSWEKEILETASDLQNSSEEDTSEGVVQDTCAASSEDVKEVNCGSTCMNGRDNLPCERVIFETESFRNVIQENASDTESHFVSEVHASEESENTTFTDINLEQKCMDETGRDRELYSNLDEGDDLCVPGHVGNEETIKEDGIAADQVEKNKDIKAAQGDQKSVENSEELECSSSAGDCKDNEPLDNDEKIKAEMHEEESNQKTVVEEETKKSLQKEVEDENNSKRAQVDERQKEREKDRIAVERAIREARERAFAEARERAERAAVERAAAEVRQRVMAEARDKREKASASSKVSTDKASIEAKLKAERAAVERATAEARERALEKALSQKGTTAELRSQADRHGDERIASATRENGLKHSLSSSDLDKFDGSNSESAQRRKARLERHQRIMERAAKALAEKNKRDLLAQKEQTERNRLAEALDADIKRWASGKEGNLRALLSTLQYILGSDSGWQPISLTEIITTAAVKKAYRKATLYVHPDKLQQRGASIQQKYICEKVFDLLKAAWNRFNSEER
ncbi:auxilin-like protein 1 [Nicotiana sylvestris]|uniref:Auxilin-like protein 1 n=1 Tax=Nicotiana sylvestris TaxID=4096 RepID=A0A1U7V2A5_NICSY|nr:PREDICTED: auxilin-like protein 1 [Nicotiana sylvestris]